MARAARHKTRRSRSPRALDGALEELVRDLGIEKPLHEYAALTAWEEIVGEQIAKVAYADRIDNGVLIVKVVSAPWRSELSLRKSEILRRIADHIGNGVIRDIRFR